MEEEIGQPFFFMGRWRGRRLWVLVSLSLLAAALSFLLVCMDTSSEGGPGESAPIPAETPHAESGVEAAGVQPRGEEGRSEGQQPEITPGSGGESPGLLIEFPDPAGGFPEAPPGGYGDICGQWILDMSGAAYGLANCHIVLNEDGTISSPPDYDQVFHIAASTYSWQAGDRAFTAAIQLMLKMGPGQVLVPVQVDLAGEAAENMKEISGSFTAQPQGEAYAPYAQQGGFRMHR